MYIYLLVLYAVPVIYLLVLWVLYYYAESDSDDDPTVRDILHASFLIFTPVVNLWILVSILFESDIWYNILEAKVKLPGRNR